MAGAGALVHAFDPLVREAPPDLAITLHPEAAGALAGAVAAVVCTEWPEFKSLDWPALLMIMKTPFVLDANAFLAANIAPIPAARYCAVGLPG